MNDIDNLPVSLSCIEKREPGMNVGYKYTYCHIAWREDETSMRLGDVNFTITEVCYLSYDVGFVHDGVDHFHARP
jgi:hypothetical protein